MKQKRRRRHKRKNNRNNGHNRNHRGRKRLLRAFGLAGALLTAGLFLFGIVIWQKGAAWTSPEEILMQYMECIGRQEYETMYTMLNVEASGNISREAFIKRNSAIYEGIEAKNIRIEITEYDKEQLVVRYRTELDTVGGRISFENRAFFVEGEERYELVWEDRLIFPGLSGEDRVKVSTTPAERGEILDRNEEVLAGEGVATLVGIVPGKMENQEETIERTAQLLEIDPKVIEKKLSAKWVKADYLVPIQTLPKVEEIELMALEPDEEVLQEQERQEKLLEIPGVMLSDTEVRAYPLGRAASHLTGYVQNVTAEDLEKHAGEGYTTDSVIGRSGMEGLFEKELKGQNGCRIYIVDGKGNQKEEIADLPVRHGQDVRLTIDAGLQRVLYEQFADDKGCCVAMNPYTGEVLALVSTPSFDSNAFIRGLTGTQWAGLNEDADKPMYNRFRQVWCPGSTFKPVIAAIGLESGAVKPLEDYGKEGLSWQKDASWGAYYVTTLHTYEPVILENALIYSDNIYFAKAALRIGAGDMETSLDRLGFLEEVPFEIRMQKSQYSNTEHIETEIQLADSGYGQGQVLVNPLHLACIYSAFCNEGNMIKPYLLWQKDAEPEYWISSAFSSEVTEQVLEGTKKVINDSHGTGYGAHRDTVLLAGKTGTAEIKASKEDTSGTELGWFVVYTAEKTAERPVLLVSMTEDVKERGGSGYVVRKINPVLDQWFGSN